MCIKKNYYIIFLTSVTIWNFSFGHHPKYPIRFSKLNVGILLQRYYYNIYHAKNVNSGISAILGFHQEFAIDGTKNKNFISFGLEYLHQSFSFNSYYFTQDTLRLYNGRMDFTYNVKLNELDIPVLYKYNFSRENNEVQGVYFSVGYVYRLLLPSLLLVSRDFMEITNTSFYPEFKIPVFNKHGNSYVHSGIGFQKNNPQGKLKMYAEIFGRYGFSPVLIKTDYSANNLYFGNYFIGLNVGIKWRR